MRFISLHIALFLGCFLFLKTGSGQEVKRVKNHLDSSGIFHEKANESLFKTLVLLDHLSQDTQFVSHHIAIDIPSLQTYILNKILQDTGIYQSTLVDNYVSEGSGFDVFRSCISARLSTMSPEERARLRKVYLISTDPAMGIHSTNEYREYVLFMMHDLFKKVPNANAPIALKAIRSFVRHRELVIEQDASDIEIPNKISLESSFNSRETLLYCLDSLELFDSLSTQFGLVKDWRYYREFCSLNRAKYAEYRDVSKHYQRMLKQVKDLVFLESPSDFWLIENESEELFSIKNEFSVSDIIGMNLPEWNLKTVHYLDSQSMRNVDNKIAVNFFKGFVDRWSLSDYNFIDSDAESEQTEPTDLETSENNNDFPKIYLGAVAAIHQIDMTLINSSFRDLNLAEVRDVRSMGIELNITDPNAANVTFQWMGQNQWINWNNMPHFAYSNFSLSSSFPVISQSWIGLFLGFDYQYERYRLSLPLAPQFIGNPQNSANILLNEAQNLGAISQIMFNLGPVYLKAHLGYRWDLSDSRWKNDAGYINSKDLLRGTGLNFGMGLGFQIYKGNEN